MNTKQHTIETLKIACLILVLAGLLFAVTAWARASEAEDSTEADGSVTQEAPDVGAIQQAPGSGSAPQFSERYKQLERATREARHKELVERGRSKEQEVKKQTVPATAALADTPEEARKALLERDPNREQEMAQQQAVPASAGLAEIDVLFKLDPRLTGDSQLGDMQTGHAQGGEAWAPVVTYSGLQEGEFTVEARVQARDSQGQSVDINPEWRPADPSVQVSPAKGNAVKITVRDTGESNLRVTGPGFSKDLWISATRAQGKAIQVRISQ